MIKCPNCARDNADNFNFCLDCGYDLKALREAFSPATQAPVSPPPPPPRAAPPAPSLVPPPVTAVPPAQPAPPASGMSSTGVLASTMPPPASTAPPTLPPANTVRQPLPPSPVTMPPSAPAAPPQVTAPPQSTAPPAPAVTVPPPSLSAPPGPVGASGVTCGSCGFTNAPGVRFCGGCGQRLDQTEAPAAAPRTMFMHAASDVPAVREPICRLVTIDQTGREGMTFTLRSGETVCGRINGVVLFDDPFVSPTHCRFVFVGGKLRVVDAGSLNGVYLRVRGERTLADGDYLRVGRQLFRFESLASAAIQVAKAEGDDSRVWGSPHPAAFGRLVQVLDDGRTGEIRLFAGERCQLGRESGDLVIPSDGFISGKHCAFVRQGPEVLLQDLGSSNGTYVRVRGEAEALHGDFLLVGNQMLRVEII